MSIMAKRCHVKGVSLVLVNAGNVAPYAFMVSINLPAWFTPLIYAKNHSSLLFLSTFNRIVNKHSRRRAFGKYFSNQWQIHSNKTVVLN